MTKKLTGLIPAVFTPLDPAGKLNLSVIPPMVDRLHAQGVTAIYINGSTGEGPSLTTAERIQTAEAFVSAASGKLKTLVQVGHNSLRDASELARHAADIGVDFLSATPPTYFKPDSLDTLIDCISEATANAPDVPFYYYHIPPLTDVQFDMSEFLSAGKERLPNLVGIKFSSPNLHELRRCLDAHGGEFDMLFGVDEMLLAALSMGVKGAIGSTYNFAAPLYSKLMEAFEHGDIEAAQQHQSRAIAMVDAILSTCGRAGLKAAMNLSGTDCGGHRLPIVDPSAEQLTELKKALAEQGAFDWS